MKGRITQVVALTATIMGVWASSASAYLNLDPAMFGTSADATNNHRFLVVARGFPSDRTYAKQPGSCFSAEWTKTPNIPGCYHRVNGTWLLFQYQRACAFCLEGSNPEAWYYVWATGDNDCFQSRTEDATWWPRQGDPGQKGINTFQKYHGCSASQFAARFG